MRVVVVIDDVVVIDIVLREVNDDLRITCRGRLLLLLLLLLLLHKLRAVGFESPRTCEVPSRETPSR